MLPELPDAKMDTRKPIAHSSREKTAAKRIFRMMAERRARVNNDSVIATVIYSRPKPWKSTISS
jgi:hypothetical protein